MNKKVASLKLLSLIVLLILTSSPFVEATIYGSISGRIIDKATGKGIPNMWVASVRHFSVQTDKNGFYIINNVRPGSYELLVYNENSSYLEKREPLKITLPEGKNITNLNIKVEKAETVSGTVFSGDGTTPLDAVHISTYCSNDKFASQQIVMTNAQGKYVVYLPPSEKCTAKLEIDGHAVIKKEFEVVRGRNIPIDFIAKWDESTGIRGYAKGTNNVPIPTVDIYVEDAEGNTIGFTSPDQNGYYSVTGLKPGVYNLAATNGSEHIKKGNITVENNKIIEIDFVFGIKTNLLNNIFRTIDGIFSFFTAEAYALGNPPEKPKYKPFSWNEEKQYKCSPTQQTALQDAYNQFKNNFNSCSQMGSSLNKKIAAMLQQGIIVGCDNGPCKDKDGGYCAYAKVNQRLSYYCKSAIPNCNGNCLSSTMMHEYIHNVGYDGDSDGKECVTYKCEDLCCGSVCKGANDKCRDPNCYTDVDLKRRSYGCSCDL